MTFGIFLGWLGFVLLTGSALPQAFKTYREGHAEGLSWGMLWLWLIGLIVMSTHVILTKASQALLLNYMLTSGAVIVIILYKAFPKSKRKKNNHE